MFSTEILEDAHSFGHLVPFNLDLHMFCLLKPILFLNLLWSFGIRILTIPNYFFDFHLRKDKTTTLSQNRTVPKIPGKVLLHSFVQNWLGWDFELKDVGDCGLVYGYFIFHRMLNITYQVLEIDWPLTLSAKIGGHVTWVVCYLPPMEIMEFLRIADVLSAVFFS